jgi:hypothetical protein
MNPKTKDTLTLVVSNSVTSVYISWPPANVWRSLAGWTSSSMICRKKAKATALPTMIAKTE